MSGTNRRGHGRVVRSSAAERALERFHEEEDLGRVYDLRMLGRLWPFLYRQRRLLFGSLSLLVFISLVALVRPLLMREALRSFQEPGGAERITRFGVALGVLIVCEQVLVFPQTYWMQTAGARAMATLRRRVFEFLHTRGLAFFDRRPIGRLVTRVTNDVDAIGEMFSSGALNAVGDLLRLIAIIGVMFAINWRMSLFTFAVLPPVMLLVNWTRKRMRTVYRQLRAKTARMNAFLNEQVNGIEVVQAFAREGQGEAQFDEINYGYRSLNTRAIVLDSTLDASIEMMGSICIAAVIWFAGGQDVSNHLDFGTLFAFVAYIDMFFLPVRNISARYTQLQSGLAGAERVFQLLGSGEEDIIEGASAVDEAVEQGAESPAFELERVSFAYKKGTPVLRELSLRAYPGETVALVGPTGSGKTTIASLLLRLYPVSEGVVRVGGRDVRGQSRTELRRQFAVVPQDVFLFPGTVASNVAAGAAVDRQRIEELLELVGAMPLIASREDGIDSVVREHGANFSAGERQLIAFARALYRDPPMLVLDEATANIDSDTEARLQRATEAATRGRTALIIAHRLSTIRNADRIVCLGNGRVVEQGSHEELLAQDGMYAKMVRLQEARRAIDERVAEVAQRLGAE